MDASTDLIEGGYEHANVKHSDYNTDRGLHIHALECEISVKESYLENNEKDHRHRHSYPAVKYHHISQKQIVNSEHYGKTGRDHV